jgi:hypothetical protein
MKSYTLLSYIITAFVALCVCAGTVSAVLLEVTSRGTVAAVDPLNNTMTIANPGQYGCVYPSGGQPDCTFAPAASVPLTGTVPDKAVFSAIKTGDRVIVTGIGGADGRFITIAKLASGGPGEGLVTDAFGDPGTIPVPLIGDYAVAAETIPDCASCRGTVCTAASANVTITSSGKTVFSRILAPGNSLMYNGRNDASSVTVAFISGQAAARACPGTAVMTGPQPVSDFIITVVPPLGMRETGTAALPVTTGAAPVLPATSSTKAGSLFPAGAAGAAGLVLLARARKRR